MDGFLLQLTQSLISIKRISRFNTGMFVFLTRTPFVRMSNNFSVAQTIAVWEKEIDFLFKMTNCTNLLQRIWQLKK